MEAMYPYFLTLHLFCAIVFLGFIFCDVVLFSILRKNYGEIKTNELLAPMMKKAVKIMPFCVFLLVITGGAMMSKYFHFGESWFGSSLQIFLALKIFLAFLIVLLVINALSFRIILKKTNPLGKFTHKLVFVFGFFIVIFAKLAFYF